MYQCFTCKKPIVAPSFVALFENKHFHTNCLVCSVCKISLSEKEFIKDTNGGLLCLECYNKTAPKCYKCNQLFSPSESYQKIDDTIFLHNKCFLCSGPCKKPMSGEFYAMENDKYVCVECYDKYGADYNQ